MSTDPSVKSRRSVQSAASATSEGRGSETRCRRRYIVRRRHELLAVFNTLVDMTSLLDGKVRKCRPAARALAAIKKHGRILAADTRAVVRPGNAEGDALAKAVNHDFRNHLTVILGNADDLRRIASKFFLEDYLDEINQLRDLGHQALELVDGTATQLRSADGCSAVDEVQGYLNRVRVEGATGLEFPTAPALVTGRILVAEDHEGIREQICGFLREQKHFVEEASNGREALEALNARPFDLVLTDIAMPEVDGFGVIEQLKSDRGLEDLPVIVISGNSDLRGITRCIEMGAEDYLPKPFSPAILKARVDACLEKKRLRDIAEHQRRRYDELLHAILPNPVVDELIRDGTVRPRRVEGVAVIFADIVSFTRFCNYHETRPEIVVQHLGTMFEAWESMASELKVQKIKTIGDAFMAAAGLLDSPPDAVLSCVRLGLKMIEYTQGLVDDHSRPLGFDLRVGLHWGTVVCGVLGRSQFLFDLWGDTVNIASRLESQGRPGCVNLSPAAWSHVSSRVRGEERAVCQLRGKPDPIEIVQLDPRRVKWIA